MSTQTETATVPPQPVLPAIYDYRLTREPAEGKIVATETVKISDTYGELTLATYRRAEGEREDQRVLEPENVILVKSVTITPLEGPYGVVDVPIVVKPGEYEGAPISALICAMSEFHMLARKLFSAQDIKLQRGGYNKCRFLVEWEDGVQYEGRFDCEYNGTEGGSNFNRCFTHRLFYQAGMSRAKREHTREQHHEFLRKLYGDKTIAWARWIIATHEI